MPLEQSVNRADNVSSSASDVNLFPKLVKDKFPAKAQRRKENIQDRLPLNLFASSLRLCAFAGNSSDLAIN